MINLKKHRKTVVHCPTEELIMLVEDQIVELGGQRLWNEHGKDYILREKNQPTGMCFGLDGVENHGNAYCDLEYYTINKYDIMTAQEFMRMCGKPVNEIINNYQIY